MRSKTYKIAFVVLFILMLTPTKVMAANDIIIDGNFHDWNGRAYITDPAYDAFANGDIEKFAWGGNDNDDNLYFMIERRGWGEWPDPFPTTYRLYFDMNDNGKYTNGTDNFADITYVPFLNGLVIVNVYSANGHFLDSYSGNWGERGIEGGQKCEFYISKDTIKVHPGQSLRMYVQSFHLINDRCPDRGDIQWSPIPIIPAWGLIAAFAAGLTAGVILIIKRRLS